MRTFQSSLSQIDCWPAASRLEILLLLYDVTRSCFPKDYAKRLRLRTPWFVRLSEGDAFPQLLTTNRIASCEGDCVLGPFASREFAQLFQEKVEGLFQLRRCSGGLMPSADHAGCIYGEMNQCLRPCQEAVTAGEYRTEAERTKEFLMTSGRLTLRNLTMARQRASAEMEFELAAQIHRQFEKVKDALTARDDVVRDVHGFSGVALTRDFSPGHGRLRPMVNGCWQEPVIVDFSERGERRQPMDVALRESLEKALTSAFSACNVSEHLALFSRWYRSTWCDGEWFPFKTLADLDYRKLVRQISKVITQEGRPS